MILSCNLVLVSKVKFKARCYHFNTLEECRWLELDFLALFRCTEKDDLEGEISRIIFVCLCLLKFKVLENPWLATAEQVCTFDVTESTVFCLFVFV